MDNACEAVLCQDEKEKLQLQIQPSFERRAQVLQTEGGSEEGQKKKVSESMKSGTDKVMEALATHEGGSILKEKVKLKKKKENEKVEQALATFEGGAIRKPKLRKRKIQPKVEEALATFEGGSVKYHDERHRYLHQKLSGKGARFDSPECRKAMIQMLQRKHPAVLQTYLSGKAKDLPQHQAHHLFNAPAPVKKDAGRDITQYGGSMRGLTHSEDGYLQHHDSEFHHFLEIV